MGTSYNPKIVTNGLVLNLDAANKKSYLGTGTVWTDLTTRKTNGNFNNSPVYSLANGGGLNFNGSNAYISGGDTSFVNGNYTVDIWFKATGVPSTNDSSGGFLFAQSNASNHGICMLHSWANQNVTHANKVNEGLSAANSSAPNNTICNAIGIWNGTTQYIYINGNLSIQRAYALSTSVSSPAYQIGRWGDPTFGRYFNGIIYSVKLYNKILTSNEVLQNYHAIKGRFIL